MQLADEDPLDRRQVCPRIVFPARSSVDHLGVHPRSADVLPHLVDDEDISIARQTRHPRFHERKISLIPRFHAVGWHGVQLSGMVMGVLQNREAAKHLSGLEYLAAHRADHVFETQPLGRGVILLRSGKLTETDRHHLHQAALDTPGEARMPLYTRDNHHAVGRVRRRIHEGFDPIGRAAERHDVRSAHDRAPD